MGLYGALTSEVEGLISPGRWALMISAVLELIEPAPHDAPFWAVAALVMAGAAVFAALDRLIKQREGSDSGGGLLAAITLDGIPENLALGVALISTGPLGAAGLSRLHPSLQPPRGRRWRPGDERGRPVEGAVLGLWAATAALLTASALAGNLLLGGAPDSVLGLDPQLRRGRRGRFAGHRGLPQAFKESGYATGLAVALGLVLALFLDRLG